MIPAGTGYGTDQSPPRQDRICRDTTVGYDLFVSYSRRDNDRGQVDALVEKIRSAFREFAGRELAVFFDRREIRGMDEWRQTIQHSLREAQLFLGKRLTQWRTEPDLAVLREPAELEKLSAEERKDCLGL